MGSSGWVFVGLYLGWFTLMIGLYKLAIQLGKVERKLDDLMESKLRAAELEDDG